MASNSKASAGGRRTSRPQFLGAVGGLQKGRRRTRREDSPGNQGARGEGGVTPVYFRASVRFTAPISVEFWRKFRTNFSPFATMTAVGGPNNAFFRGTLNVEDDKLKEGAAAYEITAALVQKVELYSDVGVDHIEFEEVTAGV